MSQSDDPIQRAGEELIYEKMAKQFTDDPGEQALMIEAMRSRAGTPDYAALLKGAVGGALPGMNAPARYAISVDEEGKALGVWDFFVLTQTTYRVDVTPDVVVCRGRVEDVELSGLVAQMFLRFYTESLPAEVRGAATAALAALNVPKTPAFSPAEDATAKPVENGPETAASE
jgi:hypothetical protein